MSHNFSLKNHDDTRLYLIKEIGEGRIYATYEDIQNNTNEHNLFSCDNCNLVSKDHKQILITRAELCDHDNHIRCRLCCEAANNLSKYFDDILGLGEEF